jgi:signal transduction histidine kinase
MDRSIIDKRLDEESIREFLDLLYEMSGLLFSINLIEGKYCIYSEKYKSKYCKTIFNEVDPEICCGFISPINGLHMCKAGLWYESIPIYAEGELIGCITVGHKRINEKDEESGIIIHDLLSKYNLANEMSLFRFLNLFENVESMCIEDDSGQKKRMISLLEKEIKREMRSENQSKNLKILTMNMGHEFLIPIQSIVANAEFLQEKISDPELKKIAIYILNEVLKLSLIAQNLRVFNINDMPALYDFSKVDINSIIIESIKLFEPEAAAKNIKIIIPREVGQVIRYIEASKPHLKQAIFNILNNAVKYSFSGSHRNDRYIEVMVGNINGSCQIEIKNYGTGILHNEIEEGLIFQPGYRGILSRDRSRIGSGLGLAIAKKIIEDHGGYIEITSKKVSEGPTADSYLTSVKVNLPIKQRVDSDA